MSRLLHWIQFQLEKSKSLLMSSSMSTQLPSLLIICSRPVLLHTLSVCLLCLSLPPSLTPTLPLSLPRPFSLLSPSLSPLLPPPSLPKQPSLALLQSLLLSFSISILSLLPAGRSYTGRPPAAPSLPSRLSPTFVSSLPPHDPPSLPFVFFPSPLPLLSPGWTGPARAG